ncbi:tyrosine-type recombinase/integrase [Proteiniclasticum sp. C24MP]|uniref:tyrosine-type recombinase/integrase n=1 Tax=Proteiniclasticum sp. C24MP TaxID=3374101 RepID=UPI00375446A6
MLTDYWKTHGKPLGWLFPGRNPDSHIVKDTGSRYIQKHLDRLKWNLPVTAHTFRHAFATHLYEQGTDLVSIKNHLGHRSLNSTLIYVHLARPGMGKAVSPFDVR